MSDAPDPFDEYLTTLRVQRRLAERTLRLYADALARCVKTEGSDQPQTVEIRLRIGELAMDQGRADEATVAFRESLESARRSVGASHPLTANAACMLAWSLAARDPAAAMARLDESLATADSTLGASHQATLRLAGVRAWLRQDEAPAEFATVFEAAREALPDRNPTRLFLARLDEADREISSSQP